MTHFIFDCDDVLMDWEAGFLAFCQQCGYSPDTNGPASCDLSEWIGCSPSRAKAMIAEFNSSEAFGYLQPRPGAAGLLWLLNKTGHTIDILTSCGDGHRVQSMRLRHLARSLGMDYRVGEYHLPYDQVTMLPLGASKFNFLYDFTRNRDASDIVFVEDNFEHAKSGVANGIKSYCLRRSHNRAQEAENPGTGVIWIDAISELAALYGTTRPSDEQLLGEVF